VLGGVRRVFGIAENISVAADADIERGSSTMPNTGPGRTSPEA